MICIALWCFSLTPLPFDLLPGLFQASLPCEDFVMSSIFMSLMKFCYFWPGSAFMRPSATILALITHEIRMLLYCTALHYL